MTKAWIKAASIRAVKTVCQCALAILIGKTFLGEVDWSFLISSSLLSGLCSLLTSVTGLPEVEEKKDNE